MVIDITDHISKEETDALLDSLPRGHDIGQWYPAIYNGKPAEITVLSGVGVAKGIFYLHIRQPNDTPTAPDRRYRVRLDASNLRWDK